MLAQNPTINWQLALLFAQTSPRESHDTSPPVVLKRPKTMESRNIKVPRASFLLLLLLFCSLKMGKQAVPDCCRQKSCPCHIFELLHGTGNHANGILTLGKRGSATATKTFQSRLYRLFHSSDNQAAGILTMGKRAGQPAAEPKEDTSSCTQLASVVPYNAGSAPGCLAPPEKNFLSSPKTDTFETIY